MNIYIKSLIDNDINLKKYLRYNSINYKYLIRNDKYIYTLINNMKKEYKLTTNDKIDNISNKISLINNIMSIIK